MKNACKHLALCTLTLILCLALAACGSDNSGDSADYGNDSTVPSTIDGFVKESYDSYDYSAFEGYYLPDSGTDFDYLIIDTNGSRWRIGNNDDLAASGYLQYDADYDCIYAYNEHDGVAYQFSADGSSVNIYSLGSFTYEMSLDEFDAQAEDYNSSDSSVDLSYLAGIWYLDGDLDADSYIYIDSSGGLWGLYERAPGAEATEVDGGFISAPTDVDDVYYAVSTTYQDVTYEFTLFDTDSIVWGGENVGEVEELIRSCGFYHGKARDLVWQAQRITEVYGGKVPDNMDDLLTLPGVGRKSANLILGDVFRQPGAVVVDTHCIRLSNRLGLVDNDKDPVRIEKALRAVLPPEKSNDFCHRLVLHGRAVCAARKPLCDICCCAAYCKTLNR